MTEAINHYLELDYWRNIAGINNYSHETVLFNAHSRYSFYAALSRLACMPHLINSRVMGSEVVDAKEETKFLGKPITLSDLSEIDEHISHCQSWKGAAKNGDEGRYFIVRRIISKNLEELMGGEFWNFKDDDVTLFQPLVVASSSPKCSEFITLCAKFCRDEHNSTVFIELKGNIEKDHVKQMWDFYIRKVIPKISQWMSEENLSQIETAIIPKCSLQLVDKCKYWSYYNSLKENYQQLKDIWILLNEPTNPEKMIHEEMGIATYLIVMWQNAVMKTGDPSSINFVDLGCGNGLLSLFLRLSNYSGRGIDMRRRKLWDLIDDFSYKMNGRRVDLLERIVFPINSEFLNEPKGSWLIGNHSDELTPWIPIWARQHNLNFFLLPCCPYDFSGKFQRKKGSKKNSIFSCYVSHIKEIMENCGYICFVDRLQIPSTKRICLIGSIHHSNDKTKEEVNDYITKIMELHGKAYKAREGQERVRNCTRLSSGDGTDVINEMAKCILDRLLTETNYIQNSGYTRRWNAGMEKLSIRNAYDLLSEKHKQLLKKQGNGIQTLMKNHSQVFEINNGFVNLRPPCETDINITNPKRISRLRSKWCFFDRNHPDGCPLSYKYCNYRHRLSCIDREYEDSEYLTPNSQRMCNEFQNLNIVKS